MKRLLIILLIFLFNINISLALIDISLFKTNYASKETFQAQIILKEKPIRQLSVTDLYLKKDTELIKVAPILTQISENNYFVYFDLPNLNQYNYTFGIKLLFLVNNTLKEEAKEEIFEVTNSSESVIINPAFIKLNAQDKNPYFKIRLENKGSVYEINVNTTEEFIYPSKSTLSLEQPKTLYLYTKTDKINKNFTIVKLTSENNEFFIPVWVYEKQNISIIEQETIENFSRAIEFLTTKPELNLTIYQDESKNGFLYVKNYLNYTLHNLKFDLTNTLNKIIILNITLLSEVKPNQEIEQYLWINKDKNMQTGIYEGKITLTTNEGFYDEFPVSIEIIEIEKESTEDTKEIESYEGDETEDELIFGDPFFEEPTNESIKEDTEEKKFNLAPTITIILIIVILLILYFKIKKYQKS